MRDLCAWLGAPPPNDLYNESNDKRLNETCEWILQRDEFLEWQATSTSDKLLWIKGLAGFGKTVLCARLIQEVEKVTQDPMAYFFLSSKFEGRDDPFLAIRSWLTTLVSQYPSALDIVSRSRLLQCEQKATQTTVLQLFREVIVGIPGCIFILDGLDECTGMASSGSKSVSHFLIQLRNAVSNTGTRLLISSRGDPMIQQGLSSFSGYREYSIHVEDLGPDLMIFSSRLVTAKFPKRDESTRTSITQKIKDRCQGQFQWIKLQEGYFRPGLNPKQLEREIDETPYGLDSLYDRGWDRINSMRPRDKDRALSLPRWAAFAVRPLTVFEITESVLMTDNCKELPIDEMPESIDDDYVNGMILEFCGSLIEIRHYLMDKSDDSLEKSLDDDDVHQRQIDSPEHAAGLQEIHLTHFSVKEYLLQKGLTNKDAPLSNERLHVFNEDLENTALAKRCLH
jgi:hypothetical protein